MAMIDRDVAHRSGGRYLVRIEDTDQAREVEGALEQFARAFDYFGLIPDEEEGGGDWGPYRKSERPAIYMSYARELLRQGKAYLCFETAEELADIRKRQQETKVPSGYYGNWAIWRDATAEQVQAKLAEGAPYVVRFRSPGIRGRRVRVGEALRGQTSPQGDSHDRGLLKGPAKAPATDTH